MTANNKRLVSIGIPTYNRAAHHLRKVIERALDQTYTNIEVVISDNCSTDNTAELVQSFNDPRLRYFRQETNIGPNNNFNFCLNQAKGEYFLLFHDDDMIDQDFVQACMSSLKPEQAVGAIFTGVRIIDEHDNVIKEHKNSGTGLSPVGFILGWFEGRTSLYLCNTLYNTDRLREVGGFGSKKNLYDDLVPTFTLVAKYGWVDVPSIKAGFRRHQGNRGATVQIRDWIEDSLYLLGTLYKLLPDDRMLLRKKGEFYFCKKMYWYASNGMAVTQSPIDYLRIYRSYNYCYSPLRYWYGKTLGRRIGRLKQAIVGI
jgi:glycosyltransferase involved in cell wall biosynthesis